MTCPCGKPGRFRWVFTPCADGNRKRVAHLCVECDITLNRQTLTLLQDPRLEEKMARYEAKVRAPAKPKKPRKLVGRGPHGLYGIIDYNMA